MKDLHKKTKKNQGFLLKSHWNLRIYRKLNKPQEYLKENSLKYKDLHTKVIKNQGFPHKTIL